MGIEVFIAIGLIWMFVLIVAIGLCWSARIGDEDIERLYRKETGHER